MEDSGPAINPADLRGILNYVPKFLGQTFVIALDGALVEHDNLPNILLDIAVLRSLQINVLIVHGIGKQLEDLSHERDIPISNSDGSGPTDKKTLELAIRASSRVSHQILEGLTQSALKCAIGNSVRSKPIGIIKGVDYQFGGKIDRIDADFLKHLIDKSIVPIVSPIGFDRNGHTLRINSDLLATEIAAALNATKILYLTDKPGIAINGELKRQIAIKEVENLLANDDCKDLDPRILSKARHALQGLKQGVSRIHILDGRIHDGLIREVFSNEGVGTLVYGNEYQQIRQAVRDDVPLIYHLTRSSVQKDELLPRTLDSIEAQIADYFVYEIDGNMIACMLLSRFESQPGTREINSLFVHPLYQKQGIGKKLVNFACHQAEKEGAQRIVALSTQSVSFFKHVCEFEEGNESHLPIERRESWASNQRRSLIVTREL